MFTELPVPWISLVHGRLGGCNIMLLRVHDNAPLVQLVKAICMMQWILITINIITALKFMN